MKTMGEMLKDDCFDNKRHHHWTGHHQHVGHRQVGKWKTGPGGMNCPCCVKIHPSKLKIKFNRWIRRTFKTQIWKLIEE